MTFPSHEDLGTADALRLVHGRLVAENIMLVSSDLLVDVNQVLVQTTHTLEKEYSGGSKSKRVPILNG